MRRSKIFPGLVSTGKTLADGTKRTYFYAWRRGPLLRAADGTPLKLGDPQFVVEYVAAHSARNSQAASETEPVE
ncbi:MAG: integrase [Tardiphaga sp.]|nr:integrase [Tardiphaga sp.]